MPTRARERKLDALAKGETAIHERLLSIRGELDLIGRAIDRLTLPRRPRIHAEASAEAGLHLLDNLLAFPRPRGR